MGEKMHIPARNWESSFPDMVHYRARKAGLALAIQKKMEARYDEEDGLGTPTRVWKWMNDILEGEHEQCASVTQVYATSTPGSQWKHLQWFLRDGSALCKLINKLRVEVGMPPVKFTLQATVPFQAMENIETFNKAAAEYGIPEAACFQTIDLYEGHKGPFLNVINCLNKLGFLANAKGYPIKYEAVEPPKRDVETWGFKV